MIFGTRQGTELLLHVWNEFAHWLLVDNTEGVITKVTDDQHWITINIVADLYRAQTNGANFNQKLWFSASKAANDHALTTKGSAQHALYAAHFAADAAACPLPNSKAEYATRAVEKAIEAIGNTHSKRCSQKFIRLLKNY